MSLPAIDPSSPGFALPATRLNQLEEALRNYSFLLAELQHQRYDLRNEVTRLRDEIRRLDSELAQQTAIVVACRSVLEHADPFAPAVVVMADLSDALDAPF